MNGGLIERNGRTENVRIGCVASAPEVLADHDHRRRTRRGTFVGSEDAPQKRTLRPNRRKEVAGHDEGDMARPGSAAGGRELRSSRRPGCQVAQRPRTRTKRDVVLKADVRQSSGRRRDSSRVFRAHLDEALRIVLHTRTEQHTVDEREDPGIEADTEREREDRCDGECGTLPDQPEAVTEIVNEIIEPAHEEEDVSVYPEVLAVEGGFGSHDSGLIWRLMRSCRFVVEGLRRAGVRYNPSVRAMQSSDDALVDIALLNRVVARDQSALGELYDRHSRLLFGLIVRILKDRGEAEEVLQDVFVQAWARAETFNIQLGSPAGWLIAIARNRAIDRLRANAVRVRAVDAVSIGPPVETPEARASLSEQQRDIQRALDMLPSEQRELIEQAYFKGSTQSELAAQFNLPLGTVKTRIRTGLLALRASLQERLIER
jgi:RNA polymerase sigma-70 factor, ECF subfamily